MSSFPQGFQFTDQNERAVIFPSGGVAPRGSGEPALSGAAAGLFIQTPTD